MTVFTPQVLADVMGCSLARAQECHPPMIDAMRRFGIISPARIACWSAQVKWESGNLRTYTEDSDGWQYEGRADLGNTQPGDGPRFRGAGCIQITGRANFTDANDALRAMGIGIDILANPELARTVQYGALISAWWWAHDQFNQPASNCNLVADTMGNTGCSRAVNLGNPYSTYPAHQEAERAAAYDHVMTFGPLTLDASTVPTPVSPPTPPTPPPASPKPPTVPPFPLNRWQWFGPGGLLRDDRLIPWQQRVGGITADGVYGPQTQNKVGALQRFRGLTLDYRIGPNTWAAAWGPVAK